MSALKLASVLPPIAPARSPQEMFDWVASCPPAFPFPGEPPFFPFMLYSFQEVIGHGTYSHLRNS